MLTVINTQSIKNKLIKLKGVNSTSGFTGNKTTLQSAQTPECDQALDLSCLNFPKNYNNLLSPAATSFRGFESIAQRKELYPEDQKYREHLAKNIHCDPDKLMSIVGPQELSKILPTLKSENFLVGEGFDNVLNGTYKANLHLHTQGSDGGLSVKELLDQAALYSNSMNNPPLIIAITNHDVLNDLQEAMKIVASDPEKYKKILIVPGIEFSSQYSNKDIFNKPLLIEILGYCIDPFDKKLNSFLEKNRQKNFEHAEQILTEINNWGWGLDLKLDEAKEICPLVRIAGSQKFINSLKKYILKKFDEKFHDNHQVARQQIEDFFSKYIQNDSHESLNKATPAVERIFEVISGSHYKPILSVAHPGRIHLNVTNKGIAEMTAMNALFDRVKALGDKHNIKVGVEANYAYVPYYVHIPSFKWVPDVIKYCNKLGFLNTGGLDTHSKDIFTQMKWETFGLWDKIGNNKK